MCYSTRSRNHGVPLSEMGCTSAESDTSIPCSVANVSASITETTILSPNAGHSNVGEYNYKCMQALQFTSDPSLPSLPAHDEPKTDINEDQAGDVLSSGKTVGNTAARCVRQELYLVRKTAAKHRCATQTHGCADIRIGWDGEIPRWRRGSELSYVVCIESFPAPLSPMVEDSMKAAIGMWNNIGVSFKQVARDNPATFAVIYENRNRQAYACSFFPNELSRELIVYPSSLREPDCLANILAHEVGHILGLRHEFANTHKTEREYPSVLIGTENTQSVMNYFEHPKQLQVKKEDLEDLQIFYDHDQTEYEGLLIRDIDPEVRPFSNDMERGNYIAGSKLR